MKFLKMLLYLAAFLFLYLGIDYWTSNYDMLSYHPCLIMAIQFIVNTVFGVLFGLLLSCFVHFNKSGWENKVLGLILAVFSSGKVLYFMMGEITSQSIIQEFSLHLQGISSYFQLALGMWIVFTVLAWMQNSSSKRSEDNVDVSAVK